MFGQTAPYGVFPNWVKIGAVTALTVEVVLFLRSAIVGQPLLLLIAVVALTAFLTLITLAAGTDRERSGEILRRVAVPAATMAVGFGLWLVAAHLSTPRSGSIPHWVALGLSDVPVLLIVAGFAAVAYLLSLLTNR